MGWSWDQSGKDPCQNICRTEGFNPGEYMPAATKGRIQGADVGGPLLTVKFKLSCGPELGVCCCFQRWRNYENSGHSSAAVPRLVTGKGGQVQPAVAKLDIVEAHVVSITVGRGGKRMLLFSLQNIVRAPH